MGGLRPSQPHPAPSQQRMVGAKELERCETASLELPLGEETPGEEEASIDRAGPGVERGQFLVIVTQPPGSPRPVCYLLPLNELLPNFMV